jgi:PadR family transcriptional regulator, regulatory protein PadR
MQAMSARSPYLGELEHLLLLSILKCEDNAYTVPIRAMLAEQGGRRLSRGALFTSLDRLEAKGLVRSRMGEPLAERGGRPRRYFEVTAAGRKAVRSARSALATLSEGLDAVLEPKS